MTIFNSRDETYKSPFGAVCCGAAVNFTVTPGPEFCACALLTFGEFADAHDETALLPCPGGLFRCVHRAGKAGAGVVQLPLHPA